jgi:hypothetical protein
MSGCAGFAIGSTERMTRITPDESRLTGIQRSVPERCESHEAAAEPAWQMNGR